MKLELHLIPESTFYYNLRNQLGTQWNKLSKQIRDKNNRTCQICGWKEQGKQYTHLHEVWEFDEQNLVQKLVGFECLCPTCHAVHHWGLSQIQGRDMDYLMEHACRINSCFEDDFYNHIKKSFEIWRERSIKKWKINVSYYYDILIKDIL